MTQPTALFLADILEDAGKPADIAQKCAAELRRLHAERTTADGVINDLVAKVRRLQIDGDARDVHLSERMKDLFKVEAQRDALLEALKTVEWHGGGSCWVVDADKIAAAIAKAEENA